MLFSRGYRYFDAKGLPVMYGFVLYGFVFGLMFGLVGIFVSGFVFGLINFPFLSFPLNVFVLVVVLLLGELLFFFDKRKPSGDTSRLWHTFVLKIEAWFESIVIVFCVWNFVVMDYSVFGVWYELIRQVVYFVVLVFLLSVAVLFFNSLRYRKRKTVDVVVKHGHDRSRKNNDKGGLK